LEALADRLARLLEARRAALGELVAGHLRLVVFLARRLAGRGLPVADLIQEGAAALLRAAAGYDWRRGVRFGTYAAPFVWQAMTRALHEQTRPVPLPVHLAETLPRLARARRRLEAALGREPRPEELARLARLRQDRVEQLLAGLRQPVSLDQPVGEEEEEPLADRLAAATPTPFDVVAAREEAARLEQGLAALSPREALVVRLRYGLGDEDPLTLEAVGERFGVTRERIRQIERRALGRLRQWLADGSAAARAGRPPGRRTPGLDGAASRGTS
ncbi:MAG TPA: sigma-70 family RNA polymerase sigma factor, partial [Thermodesulfobacteriota bacterium]|nr:sigma-70 family RNA polymerase sigma factor [Thermodesulfobacteriota bacterium]